MPYTMTISEKRFSQTLNFFVLLIAVTIIFRKPCTWIIIAFAVFNLVFLKKLEYSKEALKIGLVIASPLLLEIIMFWNNDSYALGLKSLEKSTSLLVFPLFIIGNFQRIDFLKLLKSYSVGTTAVILFFFVRFIILFPEKMTKYLNGIDLWEMGYVFSNTIGIHAPALNMMLAFVGFSNLYFLIQSINEKKPRTIKALLLLNFMLSFFFVLFVNTRMALATMLLGFAVILFKEFYSKKNFQKIKKTVIIVSVLSLIVFGLFVQRNSFMKEKYTTQMLSHIDKIGKLDEINTPEIEVYSSLVTRLSIWESVWELSMKNMPFGVGSADGKPELFKYFKETNQYFLAYYQFPTHNQYLDFLLKFGIFGFLVALVYIANIGYLGYATKNALIISFFLLFFISNLTDDFLIRFDGIVFSGLWSSVFCSYWLQTKKQAST
jgi:O-antigen ligase